MGVGMKATGKVTAATPGLGIKAEYTSKIKAGIHCQTIVVFLCNFEGCATETAGKVTPTIALPSIGDIRLEHSLVAFCYLALRI